MLRQYLTFWGSLPGHVWFIFTLPQARWITTKHRYSARNWLLHFANLLIYSYHDEVCSRGISCLTRACSEIFVSLVVFLVVESTPVRGTLWSTLKACERKPPRVVHYFIIFKGIDLLRFCSELTYYILINTFPIFQLSPHKGHFFSKLEECGVVSHVRLTIYPDGGISRLRCWGLPDLSSKSSLWFVLKLWLSHFQFPFPFPFPIGALCHWTIEDLWQAMPFYKVHGDKLPAYC